MKNTIAVFVVVLCFSAVLSLDTAGFRPSKKIQNHHMHHAVHHDLEKVEDVKEEKKAKSEIDMALEDLGNFEKDFAKVKSDLEMIKSHTKAAAKPVSETKDSFEAADNDDEAAFLEIKGFDDMNNGMEEDDDISAPVVANRMRAFIQHSVQKPDDEEGVVFGVKNDGSKRTFDVYKDGSTHMAPPPEISPGEVPPNDAKYRVDPLDASLAGSPAAELNPDSPLPAVNADMPGTGGKQWSLSAANNAPADNDVVCVCKRRGAPRGEDRVKCKRHETPTPTPVPTPTPAKGIRQCANGTWPSNAFPDAETTDIICIYYPSQLETIPPPTPQPTPTHEYPPECYDPRNEFVAQGVADEVVDKREFDAVLLQQGYHTCGC